MADKSEPSVSVPPQVYCELKTLQQMSTHDMSTGEVIDGLEKYDFDAALEWVVENPDLYARMISKRA